MGRITDSLKYPIKVLDLKKLRNHKTTRNLPDDQFEGATYGSGGKSDIVGYETYVMTVIPLSMNGGRVPRS